MTAPPANFCRAPIARRGKRCESTEVIEPEFVSGDSNLDHVGEGKHRSLPDLEC